MIKIKNLTKSFNGQSVLNRLNFTVDEGDVFGLLGPNGAGKTTIINILCGLVKADAGNIEVEGELISQETNYSLGVATQEISLYPNLTCSENLEFFTRIYAAPLGKNRERVIELIELFNLDEYKDMLVSKMSGGWKRRLNIATALVHHPKLLVLDEPTVGLDVEARYELWDLINSLRETGVTILITTHYIDEAEHLCSKIAILKNGSVGAIGSFEELAPLVPAVEIAEVESLDENLLVERCRVLGYSLRRYGNKLNILLPHKFTLKEILETLGDIHLSAVSLKNVRLEHVYLEVTKENNV